MLDVELKKETQYSINTITTHQVPVKIYALEGTYPEQENLSLGHLPHVEHEQQICNVDGLKTNKEVLTFAAVPQQLYFQEFFPESGQHLNKESQYILLMQ